MRNILQWSFWATGLTLQFMLLSSLITGLWRRYTSVFLYTIVLFFTTVIDILARLDQGGRITQLSADVFWACELVRYALLSSVVLSSVVKTFSAPARRRIAQYLACILGIAIWAAAFSVEWQPQSDMWMTFAFRDISFFTAITNLALWFTLIAARKKNGTLLMIAGGLGIQMTGEAIGQSLRQMSRSTVLAGNLLAVGAHFLCLYIWIRAFRSELKAQPLETDLNEARLPQRQPLSGSTASKSTLPSHRIAVN